ncbi:MAG TPA: RHS repeat-associated core domain-containing protein [Thermoanaerobaculia bacterium]|nr:RHS repeat-associated core domain-containing protein [Thermoanaerobaculia bacterium]
MTYNLPLGCMPPGTYPVEAIAIACKRSEPEFRDHMASTFTTPAEKGTVNIYNEKDPETGRIRLWGTYTVPPNTPNARLVVQQIPTPDENGVLVSPGPVLDIAAPAPSGTFAVEDFIPVTNALQVEVKATLSMCNGQAEATTEVDCGGCKKSPAPPTGSGDPVSFVTGNMRYTDADPLPPQLGAIQLTRTYDTYHQFRSLFGRGWWSFFDARLVIQSAAAGDTIAMTTATNESVVFLRRHGVYKQLSPKGTSAPDSLSFDGAFYVLREAGSTIATLYRASDGRFAGLRQLGTGREMRVEWSEGLPISVTDSWTELTWIVATDAVRRRIASITIGDLVWQYLYDANDNLQTVLAPGSAAWRSYEYAADRMTAARDASGNLIESHAFNPAGAATDSTGPQDEIQSVQYNVAGASGNDRITRVTMKSGAVVDYVLTPVGNAYRTAKVVGGCSACGMRNAVFAYSSDGHLLRSQDASGYITLHTYSGGRLASTETPLKPAGCDPESSPTHCLLEPATLASTSLETTPSTIATSYEYADVNWPDRVTSVVTPSLSPLGQPRREDVLYHPATGEPVVRAIRSWKIAQKPPRVDDEVPGTMLVQSERTIVTKLYEASEDADDPLSGLAPAFDPGGTFLPEWLSLPQPALLRKSIDGPRTDVEDVTSFVYYPIDSSVPAELRGRLAATKNALGHLTLFEEYDLFGNVTRMVDPNGVASEMTYDILGRPLTSTTRGVSGCDTSVDPLCATDLTTTLTYSPAAGPLETETRPGGGVTVYGYDQRGRIETVSRGPSVSDLRERMETSYDPLTGKKSVEKYLRRDGAAWVETKRESFSYNIQGDLQRITHPDATFVEYSYDEEGRLEGVRDENHASPNTTYRYDEAGRVAEVTQTLGAGFVTTRYEYDIHGNLRSAIDPNGNITSYVFDDFGNMISQQSAVTGTTIFEYDIAGNLTRMTDANGAMTTRTFDALGRPVTAISTRSGVPDETVSWTYDNPAAGRFATGRLSSMTDPAGSTSYFYERRGLLRREERAFVGVSQTSTTTFTYDTDGNRSSVAYPSGLLASYAHDYSSRPVGVTTSSGVTLVSSAQYLPFGPLTDIVYGNGTHHTMQYDARYRLTKNKLAAPASTLAEHDYLHDGVGNILSIADVLDGNYSRTFVYDDLHRLTTANTGPALWGIGSFTYDAMGNMRSSRIGDPETNVRAEEAHFTYVGNTPKIETVRSTSLPEDSDGLERIVTHAVGYQRVTYDNAGNEVAYVAARTYSPRNLLASVTDAGETFEDLHRLEYQYDGRGVRLIRAESQSPGSFARRYFTYSPELTLLSITYDDVPNVWGWRVRTNSLPAAKHDFVWFAGRPLAQFSPDFADGPHWYFADHLGTPLMQTNTAGAVVWHAEYQPYGEIWTLRVPTAPDDESPAPIIDQPLRFPGQEAAMTWEGTEERYNIHRWYRPSFARYTQADPIGLQGGVNLFAYTHGNPINVSDATGLKAEVCCRLIKSVIVGMLMQQRHCYIKVDGKRYGVQRIDGAGKKSINFKDDTGGVCKTCEPKCDAGKCFGDFHANYPDNVPYPIEYALTGPNSNTYAFQAAQACCNNGFTNGLGSVPGFNAKPPGSSSSGGGEGGGF